MAEKKKILYIVEAMGGGVFTYIVELANELVNKYDMYIAYAVRKQTPKNYKDYFDKRIIGNRISVLDRLHIKLEERKQKSQPQQQQQQERSWKN